MRLAQRIALTYLRSQLKLLATVSKKRAARKAFEIFCTPQSRHVRDFPSIYKTSESLSLKLGKDTVYGHRWHAGASKRALLLHGFESSAVNFAHYVQPLVARGYEVLSFDAPAHGRSTGKQITVVVYMELVKKIWNDYGPFDAIIGHSFGGLAATLALEQIPHTGLLKLVLIAPATETSRALDNYCRLLRIDEGTRREIEALIGKIGGHPASWFSVSRALPHLKARVLFLQDREDAQTPFEDVEPIMQQNHPGVHFVISEGLGHRRIYRDEASVKAILGFL